MKITLNGRSFNVPETWRTFSTYQRQIYLLNTFQVKNRAEAAKALAVRYAKKDVKVPAFWWNET